MTYLSVAILAFCAGTAVSFFTLPLWVSFAINVAKEGSRTDWFGLFGNVVGAAVTLIAASVAWLAVQRQITIQQRIADKQTAIQQYAILQGTVAFLQEDARLSLRIRIAGEQTQAFEMGLRVDPFGYDNVVALKMVLQKFADEWEGLADEFDRAGKNGWTFPEGRAARREVWQQSRELITAVSQAQSTFSGIVARSHRTKQLTPGDQALAQSINFAPKRAEVTTACLAFEALIRNEIGRIAEAMKVIRQNAGV
jgi:hypothetical protein